MSSPMVDTVYHGSSQCEKCGKQLTPVQVMYSDLCETCQAKKRKRTLRERMAR